MSKIVSLILLPIFILSLTGCATLFKEKNRTVHFSSNPRGADIFINGNRMGKTPLPLNLSDKKSVTVTFRKKGYEDKTYIINTKVDGGWIILDIFGGFIPIIIDAITENWHSLDTDDSIVVLLDEKEK